MVEASKQCSRCEQWLPIEAFGARRASPDGLQYWCRPCTTSWAREHRPRKRTLAPDVPPGMKWCRRCEAIEPVAAFGPHRGTRDGLQTYCRGCFADIYRQRRANAGFVVRPAVVPDGHKFCRGCQEVKPHSEWSSRARTTDGYAFRCRECVSRRDGERHLAKKYGLSVDEVAELSAQQAGVCAICLRAPAVHVDHDHATGRVRGMLCFSCNVALGQLGDSADVVRRAADYLEGKQVRLEQIEPGAFRLVYPTVDEPEQVMAPGDRPQLIDIAALRPAARGA